MPRLAFVINLSQTDSPNPNLARIRHLIHLFHGHHVGATWTVGNAGQAGLLRDALTGNSGSEIALAIDATPGNEDLTQARFAKELSRRLAELAESVDTTPSLVTGQLDVLRSRITSLAGSDIRAIIACSHSRSTGASRPLPCGLWYLEPKIQLPKRRLSGWLPSRIPSARELLHSTGEGTTIVAVQSSELERVSARGLQNFEKLLRGISWSASRGQATVTSISELVAELTRRHEVKPQRSILRPAA